VAIVVQAVLRGHVLRRKTKRVVLRCIPCHNQRVPIRAVLVVGGEDAVAGGDELADVAVGVEAVEVG
jgi:hypothetical protein